MSDITTAPLVINTEPATVGIDTIKPHPANPRQGDVGAIYESIDENDFYSRIVVQKSTGHILAGNHRWKAAKEHGMPEVPVDFVDVDDVRALKILLADNRTNDKADYDKNMLAQILVSVTDMEGGLSGTGYDGDDLDDLIRETGVVVPDFKPATFDEQDRLDQKKTKVCPNCRHEF